MATTAAVRSPIKKRVGRRAVFKTIYTTTINKMKTGKSVQIVLGAPATLARFGVYQCSLISSFNQKSRCGWEKSAGASGNVRSGNVQKTNEIPNQTPCQRLDISNISPSKKE